MIRAALLLTCICGPALAQERSDADAYFDALLNCLTVGSQVSWMEMATTGTWRHDVDAATGLHTFVPPNNANTLVVMETDDPEATRHVCDAVSLTIPTAEAILLMDDMLTNQLGNYAPGAEDELGCKAYVSKGVGRETLVSTISGGEDPTCDDPSKSTIRVVRTYNYDF
jgi:hypothetical protein